jgi:hypothetical protein
MLHFIEIAPWWRETPQERAERQAHNWQMRFWIALVIAVLGWTILLCVWADSIFK